MYMTTDFHCFPWVLGLWKQGFSPVIYLGEACGCDNVVYSPANGLTYGTFIRIITAVFEPRK